MKKTVFIVSLIILSLGVIAGSPAKSKTDISAPVKENKLSEEEITRLTKRVEEIRDMDKSDLKAGEKRELKKELKGIKENLRRQNGTVYIGGATLLLIIILVILLV